MQKTTRFFLGIDVSKDWFDACVLTLIDHQKQPLISQRFDNTALGIKAFDKWLTKHQLTFDDSTLAVIENTGVYHRLLWHYCSEHHLPLHIGNAAHIKWSFGITRSKNDRVDSERLCMYAYRHADQLKASAVLDAELLQLKDLMRSRRRLQAQLVSTRVYLSALRSSSQDRQLVAIIEQTHKAALKGLEASLQAVEKKIGELVRSKEAFKVNYDLLCSVPGIGPITAVYLICCTANFSAGYSGKQLASYAGVVPFEQSSGSSVRSRSRVHPMANKELKKLLHMCAVSSMKNQEEFRQYYERKKEEGKPVMSIINAIRDKIVLRVVAVIKRQEPYVDKWKKAA